MKPLGSESERSGRDPYPMDKVDEALRIAAREVREDAARRGTYVVIWKDGKVVHDDPSMDEFRTSRVAEPPADGSPDR